MNVYTDDTGRYLYRDNLPTAEPIPGMTWEQLELLTALGVFKHDGWEVYVKKISHRIYAFDIWRLSELECTITLDFENAFRMICGELPW